jgi:tetratricopeptide (TPR) repeat protein
MAKVIKLPFKSSGRFDLKPVRKTRAAKLEEHGQLNMFEQKQDTRIISINKDADNFESALQMHDSDIKKASALYRKAIDNGDHTSDAYCNLGILESLEGHESLAIDCFTKSLENDPRHYEAHFNLANIYADAGNLKLAKLHYEVAREVSDEDPSLHYNLAIVLASSELYDQALKSLKMYFNLYESGRDPDAEKFMILLENSVKKSSQK